MIYHKFILKILYNFKIYGLLYMLKTILVVFFAINAIFWSLFPNEFHCDIATMILPKCPAHSAHLTIGLVSFIIAFVIAQYDYLKSMF